MAKKYGVRITDKGWNDLKKLLEPIRRERANVKIGLIGPKAEQQHEAGEKLTVVEIGAVHEFGIEVPQRSFIGSTVDMHRAAYWTLLQQMAGAIYDQKIDVRRALGIVGQRVMADIRNRMVEGAGIPPPNAPSTIEKKLRSGRWNKGSKGAPRTLIDRGQMLAAITYLVQVGSKKGGPGNG